MARLRFVDWRRFLGWRASLNQPLLRRRMRQCK